jgi:hypothetical protein
MFVRRLAAFLIASLLPGAAFAQQVTSFPPANLPLSGAEVLYLVQGGQSKQTPVSTLTNTGSFAALSAGTLTVTGTTSLGVTGLSGKLDTMASSAAGAGLNIATGNAPSSCIAGDVWMTTSGVFACPTNGSPVGPFGAGGGVNNSTLNYLAYYATTGNTLSGLATANSSVLVTSNAGVPSWSLTLPNNLIAASFTPTIKNYATTSALPTVTSSNAGEIGYVTNCRNGSEGGGLGTGCLYTVNAAGTWTALPSIPTGQITVGGQALYLGSATNNQGTGSLIQTSSGSFTSGHCVQFNSSGATVDSGAACGGGSGGSGTVTSGTANQIAWYSSSGTAVAGLSTANGGVLVTSGTGVPSISTTLPASLSASTMTLISPAMSGTATYSAMTGTGKLTTAASTTAGAGLNLTPGTAPTSPSNGDLWTTSSALQVRINGSTITVGTGSGSVSSIATTSPITGGTITTTGTIACPTCALTTNGGLLTASSPVNISASGQITCPTCVTTFGGGFLTSTLPVNVNAQGLITCTTCLTSSAGGALAGTAPVTITGNTISLGNQYGAAVFNWDSSTTVAAYTYYITPAWPWTSGSIVSVSYLTGGPGSPSFNIALQINGTNVATCNGITVSSGTLTTTTCGSNTIAAGNKVTLVTSAIVGSPNSAAVQVKYARSAP